MKCLFSFLLGIILYSCSFKEAPELKADSAILLEIKTEARYERPDKHMGYFQDSQNIIWRMELPESKWEQYKIGNSYFMTLPR